MLKIEFNQKFTQKEVIAEIFNAEKIHGNVEDILDGIRQRKKSLDGYFKFEIN